MPHLYILFVLWIDRMSLFPGLGQLWLSLGLSLLSVHPCGIVSCQPLASSLLICPPLQLFLKPVCFLGANRTEKHFCKALCCEKRYINVRIQYNVCEQLVYIH